MTVLLEASSFLGAAVLLATVVGFALSRRRAQSAVVGSAGLLAGTLAALGYTLYHLARGIGIDFIPHQRAAVWFMAAFGWAGLLAAAAPARRARRDAPTEVPAKLRSLR